jgi:hypothetical protein
MEVDETLGTCFNFENFKMNTIEWNMNDVNKYGNIGEPPIFKDQCWFWGVFSYWSKRFTWKWCFVWNYKDLKGTYNSILSWMHQWLTNLIQDELKLYNQCFKWFGQVITYKVHSTRRSHLAISSRICIDFIKFNVTTNKDIYVIIGHEVYLFWNFFQNMTKSRSPHKIDTK